MKRLAWITDVHLTFLEPDEVLAFLRSLADVGADAYLITGDIGEAHDLAEYLNALDTILGKPIYFVLGNHDFYKGSIAGVRAQVEALCSVCPNLHWMSRRGVIE